MPKSTGFEKHRNATTRIALPIVSDRGMDSRVSPYFGRCWGFFIADVKDGDIASFFMRENPGRGLRMRRGVAAVDFLLEEGVEKLYTRKIGTVPFDTLTRNQIDVHRIHGVERKNLLSEILKRRNLYPKVEEPFAPEY